MTLESDNEKFDKELRQIEVALYQKFKDWENEKFLLKDKIWGDDSIIDYESFIEHLAVTVQEYLCDEDLSWWCDMDKIEQKRWDKWIAEYDIPEPTCPRCGGGLGCNYCLMTGY